MTHGTYIKTVCPPDHMEHLSFSWMDFHEIRYLRIFQKISRANSSFFFKFDINNVKFKFDYNLTRVTRTSHEDLHPLMKESRSVLLRMRNVSGKSRIDKIKTHIVCSITFFLNRTVYKIKWKKTDRARQTTYGNIIRRVRFACREIRHEYRHTHTHTIFNCYNFSTATVVRRTRLNVALYVHWLCSCVALKHFTRPDVINQL